MSNKIFKKVLVVFLSLSIVLFGGIYNVEASDSTSIDGQGYVVRGSISDKYLQGSVGGKASNTWPSVTLIGEVYIIGKAGSRVRVKDSSSTTYNSYDIANIKTDIRNNKIIPIKWYRGYVRAVISNVGVVETRWMHN
ncbi:hypothetical protein [Helcococcus kunzii]|uniref:hypothetical protein n=1 Tax=Helcococcus kunzii TaxID=40091 RepID=UPI0024ADC5A8|nr:hypothetical protein [Helcococcus kunzii]